MMAGDNENEKHDEQVHRRKLAAILRYIASMHTQTTLNESDAALASSFVRQSLAYTDHRATVSDFFHHDLQEDALVDQHQHQQRAGGILFTTSDFRTLLTLEALEKGPLFPSPPFCFYAAACNSTGATSSSTGSNIKKRALSLLSSSKIMTQNSNSSNKTDNHNHLLQERACWLRLTRLTNAQIAQPLPQKQHADVQLYLQNWLHSTPGVTTLEHLLTQRRLEWAPKTPPTVNRRSRTRIQHFLQQYQQFLRRKAYQRHLESIYNRLFEWIQRKHQQQSSNHYEELVWGLGHARQLKDEETGVLVNGPVLEVLVEVELARDGALLIRPREHTGVSLCRSVVTALSSNNNSNDSNNNTAILQQLYRTVAELEASQLAPGQPNTYVPLMKRLAVELSPGGRFRASSNENHDSTSTITQLVVSEAWCLYARPKPSSIWARDATALADQLTSVPDFVLPRAAWALTHGPGSLSRIGLASGATNRNNNNLVSNFVHWLSHKFSTPNSTEDKKENPNTVRPKPLFPLAASDAQHRIAHLLLDQDLPAVICEGPPGTGKTQTIANTICAYLCLGKRVLVTSKNAPALAVVRSRLPPAVQELVVDVSVSELHGMRQLQQTIERLANRVASAHGDAETQKLEYLQQTLDGHEQELARIDERIGQLTENIRETVQQPLGQEWMTLSIELINSVPWLMKSIAQWLPHQVVSLRDRVQRLVLEEGDEALHVAGFAAPPSDALVSTVAGLAGKTVATVANATKKAIAALPIIGSLSGLNQQQITVKESLAQLTIDGGKPVSVQDWVVVLKALRRAQDLHSFEQEEWRCFERQFGGPGKYFFACNDHIRKLVSDLDKAARMKDIAWQLNMPDNISVAAECRALDAKRSLLTARKLSLAEELVDASVVAELSRSFSVEAQSALIRFAQIAGKAKFNKASQPSKLSQRQRRRRQEYLDAFDKCCRFIPCWIATQSQISDYLPPECVFDLVVSDESSQSDVTILPAMLRGRKWLIVGDGKQVSPTENFISEEQLDTLRAALPDLGPLEDSLLPGQSFFDLCAQAFPNGRVVLNEHFRCASEIIAFSNSQFYDCQLIPLRLPMKSERISPSIIDVRLADGVKVGKVNEKEADAIVRRIEEITAYSAPCPRSIGVISLMGDDQSRLIRGRLLDAIGPQLFARHDILIGDASTFQGAERDIVILSMVCSPRSAPTQSQLMHYQRANVALSRARDQLILIRSLDISDIPSNDDVKIPIIEFFMGAGANVDERDQPRDEMATLATSMERQMTAQYLLAKRLTETGYTVQSMGAVWKNGLSVEHPTSDMRAALMIDGMEPLQNWQSSYSQQKAIERVGWKCARIDILSLLHDFHGTLATIHLFLSAAGVEPPPILYNELDEEYGEEAPDEQQAPVDGIDVAAADEQQIHAQQNQQAHPGQEDDDAIVISSDDEDARNVKRHANVKPEPVPSGSFEEDTSDYMDESNFGNVVDMAFLRSVQNSSSASSCDSDDDGTASQRAIRKRRRRRLDVHPLDGRWKSRQDYDEDQDEDPEGPEGDLYDPDDDHSTKRGTRKRAKPQGYMPEHDDKSQSN